MKSFKDVETQDAREAMEVSGHEFTAETVPAMYYNGRDNVSVPDKKIVVNAETGGYLGTVGTNYKVIQPVDFYDLAQNFIDQTGATITRTMTMKGGAVMGINFLMDTKEYLEGDPVDMNFLMMTAFNMQYSLLGRALSTRLFCMNQLPSSLKLFDIKHTTYMVERLGMALKMIGFFAKEQGKFDAKMKNLTKCRMTQREQLDWFSGLFPAVVKDSKRSETIAFNRNEKFLELLHSGKGMTVPGLRGTAYQALNALTEYANYHRPTRIAKNRVSDEVKFTSIVFGSGNALMQNGFDQLVEWSNTAIAQNLWR